MEAKIMDVLRRMQLILDEVQLRELKEVLQMTFTGCRVIQETDLQVVDRSWEVDLEEFLMSKALEGKASKTVKQYRYELICWTRKVRDNHAILYSESGRCTVSSL